MLRPITRSSVPSSASLIRTSFAAVPLAAHRPFSTSMSTLNPTSGSRSKQPYDAIIIGGGWAGLTAALRLSESTISSTPRQPSILLLESRTRLGGRAFTHTYDRSSLGSSQRRVEASAGDIASSDAAGQGQVESVDFGCSWLHGYNEGNPVRGLCDELGIPVKLASELQGKRTGSVLVGPGGEVLGEDLAQKIRSNLDSAMSAATELARSQEVNDSTSLASYLLDEAKSPLYTDLSTAEEKALASSYARLLHVPHGIPLESVSLRWLGYGDPVAGTDAAPEGGFSRVIEGLVKRMEGKVEIRTGMEVKRVEERGEEGLVKVSTKSTDGGEAAVFEGKTTICTLPLAALRARSQANNTSSSSSADSLFSPPLSKRKQAAISRTSVGDLNKVLLVYDTPQPWWRSPSTTGTFVVLPSEDASSFSSSSDLDELLRSTLLLVSPSISPRTNTCSLLVMIGATPGGGLEKFKRQDVADAIHARLARSIVAAGEDEVKGPVHNFMSRWSGHEFTQGATSSPVGVGASPLDFGTCHPLPSSFSSLPAY